MSFPARYRGECPACDGSIAVGDEVTYAAFDEVVHVNCPPDPSSNDRPVCGTCFLTVPLSGECGCA